MNLTLQLIVFLVQPVLSLSFIPGIKNRNGGCISQIRPTFSKFYSSNEDLDPTTAKLLADAKQLLEKAKSKLDNQESTGMKKAEGKDIFEKRASVTKQVMDDTGLITTDGDLMAQMSEEEEWSERSLIELFNDETFEGEISEAMMKRDVAASINAMRVRMDNKDFEKIFDARNIFIGDNR